MKILVTGSTGFIGNYLVPRLLESGNEVIATGVEDNNKIERTWINDVQYIKHNINDVIENYFEHFSKPDRLIHLAWAGLPNYNELFHFEDNLFTSYKFIKNCVISGIQDVTVIGTCFEYGLMNGLLSEDLNTDPSNPYALAKDTLRRFLTELNKHEPFNMKWIRLFYMYGEGQSKNSVLEQLKVSLERGDEVFNMSGGEQLRDYLPVDKVAEYISRIALTNDVSGIFNCCSGQPISIRKLVENYLKDNNKSIKLNLGYYPYPDFEPMAFWGDDSKLLKIVMRNGNDKM